jgi:hypothetical protein
MTTKSQTLMDNELFIKFLDLQLHPEYNHTYKLWDNINPTMGWNDMYDQACLVYSEYAHINSFKFQSDWNWLMHLAKEIRTRIIVPMDIDLNNWTHDHYQGLRNYFLAQLETVDKTKLYNACVEIVQWWIMYETYKRRKEEKQSIK